MESEWCVTDDRFDVAIEYPALTIRRYWNTQTIDFFPWDLPPDELIANVNIVPFCGDRVVVLTETNGRPSIPGGTREPGEAWLDTLRRELIEEAGAAFVNFQLMGAWRWTTTAPAPYRPHLPHPTAYRLVGYGDVEITGVPTNPDDGEQIASVDLVSVPEAMRRFLAADRADIADLYRLAERLREKNPGDATPS